MLPPRLQTRSASAVQPPAHQSPILNPWTPKPNRGYAQANNAQLGGRPQAAIRSAVPFNLALFVTALLIINHFGRPFELFLVGFRIPAVICFFGIIVLVAAGGLAQLLSQSGIALSALVVWLLLSATQSSWRSGSLEYTLTYIAFWVVLMLMVAHAPRSAKDLIRLASVTGLACLFSIFINGREVSDRFGADGTFGNSDDVALMAGYAIPFVALWALQFKNSILRYAILILGCGYLLVAVGRTATRAAIPALFLMLVVYFIRGQAMQRMWILVATFVSIIGLLVFLPKSTLERFSTIVDSFDKNTVQQMAGSSEAMASSAERRDLLRDAFNMTLENPIFGVGSGQFAEYRFQHFRLSNGARKHYIASHNTFLQISSESGILALLFYCIFLGTIYRTAARVRKLTVFSQHPDAKLFGQVSTCIEAALAYFTVCAFLMTCDRHPHQFVIAGMAIAMERLLKYWISQHARTGPAWATPTVNFANPVGSSTVGMSPVRFNR